MIPQMTLRMIPKLSQVEEILVSDDTFSTEHNILAAEKEKIMINLFKTFSSQMISL